VWNSNTECPRLGVKGILKVTKLKWVKIDLKRMSDEILPHTQLNWKPYHASGSVIKMVDVQWRTEEAL